MADINSDIKPVLDRLTVLNVPLGDATKNLSYLFIAIGALILLIAVIGLIGACCENACLLTVVSIYVSIWLKVACTSGPFFEKNYQAVPHIFFTDKLLSD